MHPSVAPRVIATASAQFFALRALVALVSREELHGDLWQRISSNLHKLVRHEILMILVADKLDG